MPVRMRRQKRSGIFFSEQISLTTHRLLSLHSRLNYRYIRPQAYAWGNMLQPRSWLMEGDERLHSLYVISDKLDLLKVLIRLVKVIRRIDNSQYLAIQTIIQEIGKMIGGWIKSVPR